jgi:hypothetical protein
LRPGLVGLKEDNRGRGLRPTPRVPGDLVGVLGVPGDLVGVSGVLGVPGDLGVPDVSGVAGVPGVLEVPVVPIFLGTPVSPVGERGKRTDVGGTLGERSAGGWAGET